MYEQNTIDSEQTARTQAARQSASLASASLAPASLSPASLADVTPVPTAKKPGRRGFAVLDAERRKEIARLGGKTAHANGNAHRFNPEEASLAGKKGGAVISENRDYMADIGRRGGLAKRGYKLRRAQADAETQSN